MGVRILQGMGTGIVTGLSAGLLLGFFGLGASYITIGILMLITYLPSGYVAARKTEHPFLSAGMASFLLVLVNQAFSTVFYGGFYPGVFVVGLVVGLILSLLGAAIAYATGRRDEDTVAY
jgi:tryptophan-rich sensory protein